MSADNWTQCPRCRVTHDAAITEAERKAEDAYGKVPVDEWKDLDEKARKMAEKDPPQTFREDYEIYGASDGVVKVSYSGSCRECGLSLEFRHDVPIKGVKSEAPQ